MALPIRQSVVEQGWPLGEYQSGATELEPDGSAQTITGLLGDDALPYRRGGVTYKSNAALGAAGLLALIDAQFGPGQRTVFAAASGFAVLDSDDATPIAVRTSEAPSNLIKPAFMKGLAIIPTGSVILFYGGARTAHGGVSSGATAYTTGTATVTQGSTAVTGTGTSWSGLAPGRIFWAAPPGEGGD